MSFDVDLHRYTISLPDRLGPSRPLEMSVVEAGPASGDKYSAPTMVFIHGFGGRAAYWHFQLEQFQEDYRVLALDLRGHGYTDAPDEAEGARYDVAELVADIEAALEVLRAPQQFTLICHSFGGALSSYFIQRHPQRVQALVIIASAVRFKLRLAGRLLLRAPPWLLDSARSLLQATIFNAARLYPPSHVVYLQNRNALRDWDGSDYLRAIACPTLVILGQRDILFAEEAYRAVAQLVPGAQQVVVQVSAHQVMVERPDAVNRAINHFLLGLQDPMQAAQQRAAQKQSRRAARIALEAARPWLKFYDARTTYRIKPPYAPLPKLLEACARRFGKTTALSFYGRNMSWRELDRLATRFAHGLLARRIRPGERVMLALPNSPQWLIAYFGILKAGAIAVLVEAGLEQQQLLKRIQESRSVLLIVSSQRYLELRSPLLQDARAAGLKRVVFASLHEYMGPRARLQYLSRQHPRLPWLWRNRPQPERRFARFADLLHARRNELPPPAALDDIAVIVYTWGSTGPALPAPLSHRNLASNALQLRHWLPEARPGDERFLALQSFASAYGLTGVLHLAVYLGASMILLPDDNLEQLLRCVQKQRPTYFPTTPKIIHQLVQTPRVRDYGLASIRVCAVSGSPLPREVKEKFEKITRGRLLQAYGLAECAAAALAMPIASRGRGGAVGLPLPDTEARILDLDSGQELGPEQAGELWLRGPQVFAGYDAPYDSAEYQARLQHGWFATGDIASMDDDGFFQIIERKANLVWRGGMRVFPRQIEEVLYEHPAVEFAQVRKQPDDEGVLHLRAEVRASAHARLTEQELRAWCARNLPAPALPDSYQIESGAVLLEPRWLLPLRQN
ncbi:alpha/beta fold hydrolase [Massilia sp. W12]|uniref:alpha/beta fold hydrolase n=1 Tax=Massilia sp. W12 TaxID=3126507 RepID=UPI0030D3EB5E